MSARLGDALMKTVAVVLLLTAATMVSVGAESLIRAHFRSQQLHQEGRRASPVRLVEPIDRRPLELMVKCLRLEQEDVSAPLRDMASEDQRIQAYIAAGCTAVK
jgi:hypothetical protein